MSRKFHVNPATGAAAACTADVKPCPHGGESGSDNHFDTRQEAVAAGEQILQAQHQPLKSVSRGRPRRSDAVATDDPTAVERKGRTMTEQEALLRDSLREMSEKLVEVRAEVGDVAFDDADPKRSKRRLKEAIEFADSRGNTHLIKKLTGADVLPSGAFRLADGKRANTDKLIDNKTAAKHVEDERAKIIHTLENIAASPKLPVGAYKFKNSAASISVTVKDGALNEAEFDKLPESVRKSISSDKSSIDINLVREHISPAKQAKIMNATQVVDTVIGRPHDVGQSKVTAVTETTGTDEKEKFESGVQNLGKLYSDARETFNNSQRGMKKEADEMTSAMKAISQSRNPGRNTFVPARSQMNGAIVTGRENLIPKMIPEVLSPAEIKKVTAVKRVPDITKAKEILSAEDFDRIFNARQVSARVTETA